MTRRISLPIEGATETECGACRSLSEEYATCRAYGRGVVIVDDDDGLEPRKFVRLPACLTAEREHAAKEWLVALLCSLSADEWALITRGSLGLKAPEVAPYDRIADTVDAIAAALRAEEEVPRE